MERDCLSTDSLGAQADGKVSYSTLSLREGFNRINFNGCLLKTKQNPERLYFEEYLVTLCNKVSFVNISECIN